MNKPVIFPDGKTYTGDFKNGKIEGKGTVIFPDRRTYRGDFKNGKIEGKGTVILPDGKTYTGDLKNGKAEGKGIIILPDGKTYTGDFKNGKAEGKGIVILSDRRTYTGDFKNGKIDRRKENSKTITPRKRVIEIGSNHNPENLKKQKTNSALPQDASAYLIAGNSDKKTKISNRNRRTPTELNRPLKKRKIR